MSTNRFVDTRGAMVRTPPKRGRLAMAAVGMMALGCAISGFGYWMSGSTAAMAATQPAPSAAQRFSQCVHLHQQACTLDPVLVENSVEMTPREAADAIQPGQDSYAILHHPEGSAQVAYLVLPTHPDSIYHLSAGSFRSPKAMQGFLVDHGVHVAPDAGVAEEAYRMTPLGFVGGLAGTAAGEVAERSGLRLLGRVASFFVQDVL